MEVIYLNVKNSDERIPFEMTYGVHRELIGYLLSEERLFKLYDDPSISDTVIKYCLSERNDKGQIIREFTEVDTIEATDLINLVDEVYNYFSEFFLTRRAMIQETVTRLNLISQQSQTSFPSL